MNIITARPHRLLPVVIERIGKLIAQGQPCMLLVPAQYTLQAEIDLMTRLNMPGSFLIDILSPARLQGRIFERAGQPEGTIFDERGKCMVLTQIVVELKDELTLYHRSVTGSAKGFIGKVSALIADLKRSGTTAADLAEALKSMDEDDPAARKLHDVQLLYAAYEQRMRGHLADAEDVAEQMRARMADSGVLNGQHVFVYGFDMITPTFARDLIQMDRCSASLTLFVETDANQAPDGYLFAPVNYSLTRLGELASATGVPVHTETIDMPLAAHSDIAQLERGLFAVGRKPIKGAPPHIALTAASSLRMEVHIAASTMRRLAAQGVPGSDMAVVYPKDSAYAALLSSILTQYGIDVYIAEKRAASGHPLARLLLSSLAVINGGWRAGDLCECLKTGFWPLEEDALDALCAYCEGTDVRDGSFRRPFTYIKQGSPDDLDALNRSREAVAVPLERLSHALRAAKSADDVVRALWALLSEIDAFETLGRMREELMEAALSSEADDCAQVWNALMETLDQLHTLLGEANIAPRAVLDLLTSGLSALELSALPPANGAVICGAIGNVRTADVSTLFVLGMNDTPASPDASLLTESERRIAAARTHTYLGMRADERAALSDLDTLKALCGARQRILISYALSDEAGGALRPGRAVQALRALFPDLPVRAMLPEREQEAMLIAPDAAPDALAVRLSEAADGKNEVPDAFRQAYAALNADEAGQGKLAALTRRLSPPANRRIDPALARALYGRPVMSVSRLETFAECPYRHFVAYGLAPRRKVEPGVDYAELGTLYHAAADQFMRSAVAEPAFPDLLMETCDRLMDDAVAPLIRAWRESPQGASPRGASLARRIRRKAQLAGRNIAKQFAGSAFAPVRSEFVFGKNGVAPFILELADGSLVYLQGRIDRIDAMPDGHIRVVDYKSGAKKFDPTLVYYGLQLQLLLYLAAALSNITDSRAAGFFYCRIADPTIRTDSRIKEEVERQIARRLALSGISLADVQILRAQGEHHAAMINKDGSPSGAYRVQMADEDAMAAMVDFARRRAAQLAGDAYAGAIDDSPASFGAYNACAFCEYADACGYDPASKPRRRLCKKTMDDLRPGG